MPKQDNCRLFGAFRQVVSVVCDQLYFRDTLEAPNELFNFFTFPHFPFDFQFAIVFDNFQN